MKEDGLSGLGGRLAIWGFGLILLFGSWQAALTGHLLSPDLLPPIGDVLAAAAKLVTQKKFLANVGVTAGEVAAAFVIGMPLGLLLGLVIAESGYWSQVLKPAIFFIFSIPKTIFLPMFILAFGITFTQKVSFGVFSTIFIVIISAFSALDSVKSDYVTVARAYGATRGQIAWRIYLPAMAPILLEAARLAMMFNLTGLLLAEMYGARAGLGQLVSDWGENFMLKELLAGILLIAAAAIAFNEAVRWLEQKCEHWRN
jgi:NitT/TauT family transport system permease protein